MLHFVELIQNVLGSRNNFTTLYLILFWYYCIVDFGGKKTVSIYNTNFLSFNLIQVDPSRGTVGFGSGLHGWAFTLKQFAEIYSSKFKIEPVKLMKRLWGDQFFSAKEKKWNKTGGDGYVRGFCQFVLDPIYKVLSSCITYSHVYFTLIYKSGKKWTLNMRN